VAQTMYTHVSKCKNNKIKGEEKINPYKPQEKQSYRSISLIYTDTRIFNKILAN
jgi:hypothetical protein